MLIVYDARWRENEFEGTRQKFVGNLFEILELVLFYMSFLDVYYNIQSSIMFGRWGKLLYFYRCWTSVEQVLEMFVSIVHNIDNRKYNEFFSEVLILQVLLRTTQ